MFNVHAMLRRQRRLMETNYGALGEWSIELDNHVIAWLSDPVYDSDATIDHQSPVVSYKIAAPDAGNNAYLYENSWWEEKINLLRYRNREFDICVAHAFPIGTGKVADGIKQNGRVLMRFLYIKQRLWPLDLLFDTRWSKRAVK